MDGSLTGPLPKPGFEPAAPLRKFELSLQKRKTDGGPPVFLQRAIRH
jgi:hypothetical protein